MDYFYIIPSEYDAQHHGVLGMKWGVRRYQNEDGSLTPRGRRRLGIGNDRGVSNTTKSNRANTNKSGTSPTNPFTEKNNMKTVNKILKDTDNCSLCTFAMDLRKRGIDVRAGGSLKTDDGTNTRQIASWYKGNNSFTSNDYFFNNVNSSGTRLSSTYNKSKSDSKFKNDLLKGGDGSYGHAIFQNVINSEYADKIGLKSQFLGGHDVFYQVENGEVYIIDAQSGEKCTYDEYVNSNNSVDSRYSIMMYPTDYLRTDQLEPDIILDEKGNLSYSPELLKGLNLIDVVKKHQSPTSNYSPPTTSIRTKPMSYSPPYKSKSEMDLFKEDAEKVINKVSDKLYDVKIGAKDALKTFTNTAIDVAEVLLWLMF